MPLPIPEGSNFYITHRIMPANYAMPFLQMSPDHYSMGYHISGSRTTITPTMTYTQHPGALGTIPPLRYHQTFPASKEPYENILVKFNLDFVKPFIEIHGTQTLDLVFAYPSNRFEKKYQDKVYQLLLDMIEVYEDDSQFKEFKLQCMLFQLFTIIIEHRIPNEETFIHKTTLSHEIISSLCYLESHYAEDFTIDDIAKKCGFSTSYFSRLFKAQLGKSYSEYLSEVKIGHVEALLVRTNKSITQIALETGFAFPSNLTEHFKKKTGMTPSEYRKQIKKTI